MHRKFGFKAAIILILLAPFGACMAFSFGKSNLGFSGYPSHSCIAPSEPYKPFSFNDEWELNNYKNEIESYNRDLEEFIGCITDYVAAAKNDIEVITNKANEAVHEIEYL